MNNQLILGKIVRRPKNGSYRLFEATINGEPCYCMTTPSQSEKIIFDHTKSVLTAMKRVKAYYGKSKKVRIGFKEKHLGSVLFRIYNGNDIWKSTHYSMLKDRSMESEGILDYRSSNMESAEKKPPEISIIHRPGEPLERYIVVTYMGVTEIFDYSERVYNYLLDKKIQIVLGKGSNTTPPRLKSRKNKFASSSFLSNTIFKLYMGGLGSSEHCSHIHSGYRWNNCLENLMVMDGSTNDSMSDLASRIGGHIQMYSIVYRNSEGERILVELSWIGVGRFYFVCRTPETYLNFQKIITGVAALNKQFKRTAEEHGLIVTRSDKYGWSHTAPGDPVLQFVLDHMDELREIEMNRTIPQLQMVSIGTHSGNASTPTATATPAKSSYRRMYCPNCNAIVRSTRKVNVICGDCLIPFVEG